MNPILTQLIGCFAMAACSGLPVSHSRAADAPMIWGINGHPTFPDYSDWVPGNMAKAVGLVKELGCTYYRCPFTGAAYPAVLSIIVPPAQAAGVTILPIFPLKISASATDDVNYQTNYKAAYGWGSSAIRKNYNLPYWELGNELENGPYVSVVGDGSSPNDFPDKATGGLAAIASSLHGAYQGLKDAYSNGRSTGQTTLVPQILFGATYRHWGLLTKIQQYAHATPWDIISWHWYEPSYGSILAPIQDAASLGHNRSVAACLADFKTPEGTPMDVWITEMNRSVKDSAGKYENGSFSKTAPSGQDWAAEAKYIQVTAADLERAGNIKAIFAFELLDEPMMYNRSAAARASEGCYGLMTSLQGQRKDAFSTYQAAIKSHP